MITPYEEARLRVMLVTLGMTYGDFPLFVEIAGNPYSKSRPRFRVMGKGAKKFVQTYSAPEDVVAEKRTAAILRSARFQYTGNVCVAAMFFRDSRQSVDFDNLIKHVCDAGNQIAWLDDSQITASAQVIELDADNPRTLLAFARHSSTMLRGTDAVSTCHACGDPCDLDRKYCGRACSAAGSRKGFVPYLERIAS